MAELHWDLGGTIKRGSDNRYSGMLRLTVRVVMQLVSIFHVHSLEAPKVLQCSHISNKHNKATGAQHSRTPDCIPTQTNLIMFHINIHVHFWQETCDMSSHSAKASRNIVDWKQISDLVNNNTLRETHSNSKKLLCERIARFCYAIVPLHCRPPCVCFNKGAVGCHFASRTHNACTMYIRNHAIRHNIICPIQSNWNYYFMYMWAPTACLEVCC